MAISAKSDPYYYMRPLQQVDAQRTAIGQRPQYSADELTNMIGANFQAQQQNEQINQDFVLRKEASDRAERNLQMQEDAMASEKLKNKITTPLQLGGLGAMYGGQLGLGTMTIGGATAGAGGAALGALGTGAVTGATEAAGAGLLGAMGTGGTAGFASTLAPAVATTAVEAGSTAAATGAAAGMTFSPIGALVGLGIGSLFAFAGDESVICTELNRQGYLPDDILALDTEYHYKHVPEDTYLGYRMWADTVVGWMRKSKLVTWVVKPFCRAWAYEMAHRINPEIEGSRLGALMCYVGVPACQIIYHSKHGKITEVCNG